MREPRHLSTHLPCARCGARWVVAPDGKSGMMTHTETCTHIAGIDAANRQFGQAWIAGCYGVEPTDTEPPRVTINFPDWAPLTECAPTVVGRTDRVTDRPATVYTPPEDLA